MSAPLPMTNGRRVALVLGVPLAFALIAWMGLSEVAYAGLGSYPVRLSVPVRGGTVHLSAGSADVQVTQGAAADLRLTGTARYSLIPSTVTWQASPSGVILSPRCHFITGICSFSLRAVLPAGKRVVLSDGSGNLAITGLASPDVLVTDGSGNVTLTFSKVPARVRVSDSSGDVTVVLPPGPTRYRVYATTSSGNRVVHVPQGGGPGHTITVTDGSGNVSVTN